MLVFGNGMAGILCPSSIPQARMSEVFFHVESYMLLKGPELQTQNTEQLHDVRSGV